MDSAIVLTAHKRLRLKPGQSCIYLINRMMWCGSLYRPTVGSWPTALSVADDTQRKARSAFNRSFPKFPSPSLWGDRNPRLTKCSLDPLECSHQTGSESVQPFLHSETVLSRVTDRLTDWRTDTAHIGNNSLELMHSMQPNYKKTRRRLLENLFINISQVRSLQSHIAATISVQYRCRRYTCEAERCHSRCHMG